MRGTSDLLATHKTTMVQWSRGIKCWPGYRVGKCADLTKIEAQRAAEGKHVGDEQQRSGVIVKIKLSEYEKCQSDAFGLSTSRDQTRSRCRGISSLIAVSPNDNSYDSPKVVSRGAARPSLTPVCLVSAGRSRG